MRALVFKGFGNVAVEDVPRPTIGAPDEVILRVTRTAICGSDLHVIHGRIPGMSAGSILGHEFVGVVDAVGRDVHRFKEGDRALASFIIPCGSCWFCQRQLFSRCPDCRVFGYGAFLGDVDGGQAEYVRVPSADLVLHPLSALTDEQALFAGDIFTTGYDCAVQARIEPGEIVVVQGCGPVGLMAIQAVRRFQPSIIYAVDTVADRLEMARRFGAEPVDASKVHVASYIQDHTDDRGADVLLECVGAIPALVGAIDIVRAGGRITVIGVYSEPEIELPLNISFVKAIEIHFCGTANIIRHWDDALAMVTAGDADPAAIITHRMSLSAAAEGYQLFGERRALKVVLDPALP